jgi:hypothetical protein
MRVAVELGCGGIKQHFGACSWRAHVCSCQLHNSPAIAFLLSAIGGRKGRGGRRGGSQYNDR